MFVSNQINLFLLITIFFTLFEQHWSQLSPAKHAAVGDYPKMNTKCCGLVKPASKKRSAPKAVKAGKSIQEAPKTRVINGDLVVEGEFPWVVSIHYLNGSSKQMDFLCTGSLFADRWVITAAHCFKPVKEIPLLKIYLGSVVKSGFLKEARVWDFFKHPEWADKLDWDIAVVKLVEPVEPVVKDNKYVINSICLPERKILNVAHEDAVVAGWGWSDRMNADKNDKLRKTTLLIDPYPDCLKLNYGLRYICGTEGEHMTCYGDSGGPLMQFVDNKAVLIGEVVGGVNWNRLECGPGIHFFHRISHFIEWIEKEMDNPTPNKGYFMTTSGRQIPHLSHTESQSKDSSSALFSHHFIFAFYIFINTIVSAIVFN